MNLCIVERKMSAAEFARMKVGFDEHSIDNQVTIQGSDRFGTVALDGETFIGCASGLAYKHGGQYSGWFFLTDLFVEKAYRYQGVGSKLLHALEKIVMSRGVDKIWVWTASYEGPGFYQRQGYTIFAELEEWYSNGDSRIALRKLLKSD